MTEVNIFEQASRLELRFQHRGSITVEDLWNLHTTHLQAVGQALQNEVDNMSRNNRWGVSETSKERQLAELRLAIVTHIYDTRVREKKEAADEIKTAKIKEQIKQILATKETEDLQNKTPEELRAMLESL